MTRCICLASAIAVLVMASCGAIGQTYPAGREDESEESRGNVHLGTPLVIPLNPTAQAVHLGFGLEVGGGFNFTRRHAAVGEFMWNNLLPTNEALAKLRVAFGKPNLDASSNLMALTGNYRYELRGRRLGTYFLGGGGLYYRSTSLSETVTSGSTITCTPTWEWYGFTCTSGTVTENQTVGSWSTSSAGANGGIGFTARVGDPPYRFYVQSRYHYAPNKRINTQLIDISFGIRY